MLEWLAYYTPEIVSILATLAAVLTTAHIVLHKKETRSAIGWIGLSWLVPLLGSALYLMLGINRIQRRAESLLADFQRYEPKLDRRAVEGDDVHEHLPPSAEHLAQLAHLVDEVAERPLLAGNSIEPLFNGDQAYPAMLDAIEAAEASVTLLTYIFDNDKWGRKFADALIAAVERGVEVRVLIDAAGLRYSFPSILGRLKRGGVRTARFLPSLWPPHLMTFNLRNHRKIMVVDGKIGFTGGMNIRTAHVIAEQSSLPTRDLQFRLEGPIVSHLQEIFVDDWAFSAKEKLRGEAWFPRLEPVGELYARGIVDGPDANINKVPWTIQGALACAESTVRVVTPYFLPDESIVDALNVCAMRGVRVDIIMPETNNLPYVQWASFGQLRPLLVHGCNLWLTPPPFEHSKLTVVDSFWALFGSSNWDPRSHRLNFEFDVECYDADFAGELDDWAAAKLDDARLITLEEYDDRRLWRKLRDGTFRLMAPYL
ncbi:MAG: phospholipase D-like domain-containing protein [Persicimonas sp.]